MDNPVSAQDCVGMIKYMWYGNKISEFGFVIPIYVIHIRFFGKILSEIYSLCSTKDNLLVSVSLSKR